MLSNCLIAKHRRVEHGHVVTGDGAAHRPTIGTWKADTEPEKQAQDIATAIDIARMQPQIFAGVRAFDLSDLGAAIAAVTEPRKTGNVVLRF